MSLLLRDLVWPAAELPEANVCLGGLALDSKAVQDGSRADAMPMHLNRALPLAIGRGACFGRFDADSSGSRLSGRSSGIGAAV